MSNTKSNNGKKFLKHPLALIVSLLSLAILLAMTYSGYKGAEIKNQHHTWEDDKCMFCTEPATREVTVTQWNLWHGDVQPSEYYYINGSTYERTSTGYVPRKDTYLVPDENGLRIETKRTWEEKTYSEGSTDYTDITGLYCELHQYCGERLIRSELFRIKVLENGVVRFFAVFAVLPWLLVLLSWYKALQKTKKAFAEDGADADTLAQQSQETKKQVLKTVPAVAVILVAVLAAGQTLRGSMQPQTNDADRKKAYAAASELAGTNQYGEAASTYRALGDYQDSPEQAQRMSYAQAEALMEDGSFEEASAIFESLGEYQDSAERAANANLDQKYADAIALIEEGQEHHGEARAIFEELGDYKDARKYLDSFVSRIVSEIVDGDGYYYGGTQYTYLYNENGEVTGGIEVESGSQISAARIADKAAEMQMETVSMLSADSLLPSEEKLPSGSTCEYDGNGWITKVTTVDPPDPTSLYGGCETVTVYKYNGEGLVSSRTITQTYSRHKGKGPSNISQVEFGYDSEGRVIRADSTHVSFSYSELTDNVKRNWTQETHEYTYGWVYAPNAKK